MRKEIIFSIVLAMFFVPAFAFAQIADIYEEDNSREHANSISVSRTKMQFFQQHNFYAERDVDWAKFHAIPGPTGDPVTYKILVENVQSRCFPELTVYYENGTPAGQPVHMPVAGQPLRRDSSVDKETLYYLKISHMPGYSGVQTGYTLQVYKPGAPGIVTLYGAIAYNTDCIITRDVTVTYDDGSTVSNNGYYEMEVDANSTGSLTASVSCGFSSFGKSITLGEADREENISLEPFDVDCDGICDPGVTNEACTGSDKCKCVKNHNQGDADQDSIGDCCDTLHPGCGGCGQPACDTNCSQP